MSRPKMTALFLAAIGAVVLFILLAIAPGLEGPSPRQLAIIELNDLRYRAIEFHELTGHFPRSISEMEKRKRINRPPIDPWGLPYGVLFPNGDPVFWSMGPSAEKDNDDLFLAPIKRHEGGLY